MVFPYLKKDLKSAKMCQRVNNKESRDGVEESCFHMMAFTFQLVSHSFSSVLICRWGHCKCRLTQEETSSSTF